MNRISSLLYRFRPIRLVWWKIKRRFNKEFNDRETLQYMVDHVAKVFIPSGTYYIDHTIYLGSYTQLTGSYRGLYQKVRK